MLATFLKLLQIRFETIINSKLPHQTSSFLHREIPVDLDLPMPPFWFSYGPEYRPGIYCPVVRPNDPMVLSPHAWNEVFLVSVRTEIFPFLIELLPKQYYPCMGNRPLGTDFLAWGIVGPVPIVPELGLVVWRNLQAYLLVSMKTWSPKIYDPVQKWSLLYIWIFCWWHQIVVKHHQQLIVTGRWLDQAQFDFDIDRPTEKIF